MLKKVLGRFIKVRLRKQRRRPRKANWQASKQDQRTGAVTATTLPLLGSKFKIGYKPILEIRSALSPCCFHSSKAAAR